MRYPSMYLCTFDCPHLHDVRINRPIIETLFCVACPFWHCSEKYHLAEILKSTPSYNGIFVGLTEGYCNNEKKVGRI